MRVDIITQTASGVLDASGNGTLTIAPSVGQWWAPLLIRVSADSYGPNANPFQGSANPYAELYYGAPTILDTSTRVDDTIQGNNDTSGILSGTVVPYGQALTVKWTGGLPRGRMVFVMYGQSSDTAPAFGFSIPQIMGPHFSGKPTSPQAWQAPNTLSSLGFNFGNPANGDFAVLLPDLPPTSQLYLHSMQWSWSVTNTNISGNWVNGLAAGAVVMGSDRVNGTDSRFLDWKGMALRFGDGITFYSTGPAAANASICTGTVVYAVQAYSEAS
jgi:hypothetical protein